MSIDQAVTVFAGFASTARLFEWLDRGRETALS